VEVIIYEPGKPSYFAEIKNTLEAMQKTVGGYIEAVHLTASLVAVCDEEGKLKGKLANRILYDFYGEKRDVIVGTFFVCRVIEDRFTDATDNDRAIAAKFFKRCDLQ